MRHAVHSMHCLTDRLRRDCRGVSAVEFALLAPVLVGSLIAMVDLGLATGERMAIDRGIRAGASAAMAEITDTAVIRGVVEEAASGADTVTVTVAEQCECAGIGTLCSNVCTGGAAPDLFIEISASKVYDGLLLDGYDLSSSTRVQMR